MSQCNINTLFFPSHVTLNSNKYHDKASQLLHTELVAGFTVVFTSNMSRTGTVMRGGGGGVKAYG